MMEFQAEECKANSALKRFQNLWNECEPYSGGTSVIPHYQTLLYYTHPDGDARCINLLKAGTDELATLYNACKPAEFGLGGETVLDETYRRAKKMELGSFSTPFDPRSVGILDQISKALLTGKRDIRTTEMELYKLNVYGVGDFFKPHKDTPRSETMFGSLVVVLPTKHEGGQLVLRQGNQEWTIDFADTFSAATEPSVCYVAFFGDVEHEVLPITSGYRITLTYNLYHKPSHAIVSSIPTPFHERLKKSLIEFIDDESILPDGGYLGYGLVHEYVYNESQRINVLLDHLKGIDQILATVCEELGLRHSLALLYRELCWDASINVIADRKLAFQNETCIESDETILDEVLEGLSIDNVEGVHLIGHSSPRYLIDNYGLEKLDQVCKNPVTQVLEIRRMSSVQTTTPYVAYGNESYLTHVYGQACMLIAVDPASSRKKLSV